jgi:hypothetical protein
MSRSYTSSPPQAPSWCVVGQLQLLKVKLSWTQHAHAKGERMYSPCSFLTLALDGVSGQLHAPAALYPRERTPGNHWIGGLVGLVWTQQLEKKSFAGDRTPVVQSIVRQYKYWLGYPSSSERRTQVFQFWETLLYGLFVLWKQRVEPALNCLPCLLQRSP